MEAPGPGHSVPDPELRIEDSPQMINPVVVSADHHGHAPQVLHNSEVKVNNMTTSEAMEAIMHAAHHQPLQQEAEIVLQEPLMTPSVPSEVMPSTLGAKMNENNNVSGLCCEIVRYYDNNEHIDLILLARDSGSARLRGIHCHRLVLGSISATIKKLLRQAERDLNRLEPQVVLHLPEFDYTELKNLVDVIYHKLAGTDPGFQPNPAILGALGISPDFAGYKSSSSEVNLKRSHSPVNDDEEDEDISEDEDFIRPSKRPKLSDADQPYKCKICPKTFFKKPVLVKHEKKCYQANKSANVANVRSMLEKCEGTLEYVKIEDAFSRNEHKRQSLWKGKKACVNVSGNIDLEDCLDDEVGDRKVERRKASLRVILGVRKTDSKSEVIHARPLAWSDPATTEMATIQFEDTVNIFKMLYGFSDADLYTFPDLVHKHEAVPISIETLNERRNRMLIHFRQQSADAVKSTAETEGTKIGRCYERTDGKRIMNLKRQQDAKVILKKDLELRDINNVVCCLWTEGSLTAIMYPLLPSNRRIDRAKSSAFCLKVLLDVWCTNISKFPFSSFVLEMYQTVCDTVALKEALDQMMPEKDAIATQQQQQLQQPQPTQQQQQPQLQPQQIVVIGENGQQWISTTYQQTQQHLPPQQVIQQQYYQQPEQLLQLPAPPLPQQQLLEQPQHPQQQQQPVEPTATAPVIKDQQQKEEECNCDIDFEDSVQKRRHMLLSHSNGRYAQCKQCSFIGTHAQISWHEKNAHKEYSCDQCGKTFKTHHAALEHATKHDSYTCNICHVTIVGKRKYKIHMDRNHTGTWRCGLCNSEFNCQSSLRNHEKRIHTPDDQKPHRCEECGKGFIIKTALRTHMMNVHIKARPYACQYGCGATYNDVSNRAHHENKKHGAVFNPEKHKALLQQQQLTSN